MSLGVTLSSVSRSFDIENPERNLFKRLVQRHIVGQKLVFRDVNLEIRPGERLCLVGPNGSGKTTLLKLIAGLIPPDSGEILVGGTTAYDRGAVGLMLSIEMLYPALTAYQVLEHTAHLYHSAEPHADIERVSRLWGLEKFLDVRAGLCSNGMKARLALARATLPRPELLLLDEPTVFLDKEGVERLVQFLKVCPATVVLTTHQPEILGKEFGRWVYVGSGGVSN